MRKIKWSEIEKHGFIVIHGKVYNVENFKMSHPGGDSIIEQWQGKDCTEPFENVGHSHRASEILKTLYVGDLDLESTSTIQKRVQMFGLSAIIILALFLGYIMYK